MLGLLIWLHSEWNPEWIQRASHHPLLFCAAFILATLLAIPATPLVLVAGATFGPWKASLVVGAGAYIGSLLTFLLGRYWLHPLASRLHDRWPVLKTYSSVFEHHGVKIVFCLRLSPLLPYNVANYAFGATPVSLKNYCLGNFGMLPHICVLAFLGGAFQAGHPLTIVWTVLVTVLTTWLAGRYAREALNQDLVNDISPESG